MNVVCTRPTRVLLCKRTYRSPCVAVLYLGLSIQNTTGKYVDLFVLCGQFIEKKN